MNKQELSAKWSKYCNTDKLVDDMMALLTENRHRNTEHGVCTVLDTYFTNKEPLIKMFMTSKNYIGDMRISVEKEFIRDLDARKIRMFIDNIGPNLHIAEMLCKQDKEGKTLFDHLATGRKVLDITELPNATQQKAKLAEMSKWNYQTEVTKESHDNYDQFFGYMSSFRNMCVPILTRDITLNVKAEVPVLKQGTKTSRAFNKVCAYYGVDKLHPETKVVNGVEKTVYPYDKVFAEYADLVNVLTRKLPFIISLNPLDYLTMSNGVNWVSCHNIRSGSCMGGTMSYMLDKVSIITFVVEKIEDDIHKIPKVYRQMYHYEKNLFIQNRLYPQGNDGATNLYDTFQKYVIEEFDNLLGAGGEWETLIGPHHCKEHAKNAAGSQHYPDHTYNRNAAVFYPTNNKPSIQNHIMTIGHMGICVNCGKEYNDHGRLTHYLLSKCEE